MAAFHKIHFANRDGAVIQVSASQTILDAALDAGVPISFGCLYGDCTACASTLLSGDIVRGDETGLTSAQQAEGLVLLCVARACGDCEIWVGACESSSGE